MLNKFHVLLLVFFYSCNFKSETDNGLKQKNDKNEILSDTIELIKTQKNDKQGTKIECNELQGIWKMFRYIPTMNDNQKLDTNINLRIDDSKLLKIKFKSIIDSTSFILKVENKRRLFYWQNSDYRYIRYIPNEDILILNKKGFDGGIEYYERKRE